MAGSTTQEVEDHSSTSPSFSFGEVEAMLAKLHRIDDAKRIAFQGRLKHFLKLELLPGVKQGRGKAATFAAIDVATLALATEVSQFGLLPERVVEMLAGEARDGEALVVATTLVPILDLYDEADQTAPERYLIFDPHAWRILTDAPAAGVVLADAEVARDVASHSRRLAQINVTMLLRDAVSSLGGDKGRAFLKNLKIWSERSPQAAIVRQIYEGQAVRIQDLATDLEGPAS